MLSDGKIIPVKFLNLAHHVVHQFSTELYQLISLVVYILQLGHHLRLNVEYCTLQSHRISRCFAFVHAEKLKVPAEVKDIKLFLVLAVVQKLRA